MKSCYLETLLETNTIVGDKISDGLIEDLKFTKAQN